MPMASHEESSRIARFRRDLIKVIPKVPNTRASSIHLEAKPISGLIIDYVNWRSRYVGNRPRSVTINPLALIDQRWVEKSQVIKEFLDTVEQGFDLTPNLSKRPHTKGYSVDATTTGVTREQAWSDKDFVLNTKGYHHFHFGNGTDTNGYARRSNLLVFAKVLREEFHVIALFDHDVFKIGTTEWLRLQDIHNRVLYSDLPDRSMVAMGNIASSGHSDVVIMHSQRCARVLQALDPKLDEPNFVKNLYDPLEQAPMKSEPSWCFHHLDLAIYDHAKPGIIVVEKAWA